LGEADFETKSGKGRRNFGTDYSCSEFHVGFNGAKTGFLSPTVREIFVKENGKIGKLDRRFFIGSGSDNIPLLFFIADALITIHSVTPKNDADWVIGQLLDAKVNSCKISLRFLQTSICRYIGCV
jgi:hypothetical protein